jgi:hypothetical protein
VRRRGRLEPVTCRVKDDAFPWWVGRSSLERQKACALTRGQQSTVGRSAADDGGLVQEADGLIPGELLRFAALGSGSEDVNEWHVS